MKTSSNIGPGVRAFTGWFFCLLFGLLGLASLFTSVLSGLFLLLMGITCAPPFRKLWYQKFPKTSAADMNITLIGLFLVSAFFQDSDYVDPAQRAAQEAKEAAIEEFSQNRASIIASVKESYDKGSYLSAQLEAQTYLASEDPELKALFDAAKAAHERKQQEEAAAKREAERKAKTERLVAQLKAIPAAEIHRNQALYAQLVQMNPDNERFKEKLDHYTAKVDEQKRREAEAKAKREKEHQERVARFGERPTQSAWDGSYFAVDEYLRRVANDPDSIEISGCTEVNYHSEGWLVGCNYRGRNGFGGMVRQANWFTIRHGRVVQMHDADAFRSP